MPPPASRPADLRSAEHSHRDTAEVNAVLSLVNTVSDGHGEQYDGTSCSTGLLL